MKASVAFVCGEMYLSLSALSERTGKEGRRAV